MTRVQHFFGESSLEGRVADGQTESSDEAEKREEDMDR